MKKWQRIQYMPLVPLGEKGTYLTSSQAHIDLSRRASREGMVLLKNDQGVLPLKAGTKLAVFGKAQADYVKGGGGSGDTTVAYRRSLLEGLQIKEAEGKLSLFAPLSDFYQENVSRQYASGTQPGATVEPALPDDLLNSAKAFADTAMIAICRFSGEGYDRTGEAFDGDFFLSREETALVEQVLSAFDRVVLVLNTGGMMDTLWFKNQPKICAALLTWQAGIEGGLAAADLLCGDDTPSGKLTDTFAVDFAAYPSSANFNESEDYVEYEEDIYVGYRYFETIPGAADKVSYPFGYGLSYTTFQTSQSACFEENGVITVTAAVTNTGSFPGKEILQVYCQAPQGKLYKPARVLTGFAKTRKLSPGESQTLTISFPIAAFASYDDLGLVQKSAYVLEAGEYHFYLGGNVRDTVRLPYTYVLREDKILEQLQPRCVPHDLKRRMVSDGSYLELTPDHAISREPWDENLLPFDGEVPDTANWPIPYCSWGEPDTMQLMDVFTGKLSLDAFMKKLTDEQMIHLLGGQPNRGPANTFGFGNLPLYGVPNVMTADGPAGLRIRPECGVNTTAFPCATLLACTWNEELLYEVGAAAAAEVQENGIGIWLAPAINIHRNALCGRNFEYYSEDPLVAGKLAASLIRGVQSRGIATSLKHFACNNKETNRRESDSRLSERALREIYLKAFEICVKEAQPWTIMSSYNLVNGVRASENRELLTDILRGEWGFEGLVTTDWYTHAMQYREIAAGNDIKMGKGMPKHTLQMLQEGKLDRKDLETSVRRLLELLLKLA